MCYFPPQDIEQPSEKILFHQASNIRSSESFIKSLISRLIKQSPGYSIAVLAPAVTGFILLPVFTRYLSPAEYGVYALLQVVSVIFGIFTSLGIPAMVPFYFTEEKDPSKRRMKLGNLLIWMTFFNLTLFGIFVAVGSPFFKLAFPTVEFYPFIIITLFMSIFSPYIDTPIVTWRMKEDASKVAYMTILKIILISMFQLYFLIIMKEGLMGLLLGSLLGTAFSAFIFMISIRSEIALWISWNELKKALMLGLPSVPNNIFTNTYRFFDRVILERAVSHEMLGLYYIALRFGDIVRMGIDVFSQAWMPIFYKEAIHRDKWKDLIRISTLTVILIAGGSLILYFLSELFVSLALDRSFNKAIYFIPFVIIAQMLKGSYIFPHFSIWLSKKTYYFPLITFIPMIISMGLNIYFIPIFGVYGAASVMVFSFLIHTVLTYSISRKALPLHYDYALIAFVMFFAGFLIFAKSALMDNSNFYWRSTVSLLLFGLIATILIHLKLKEWKK